MTDIGQRIRDLRKSRKWSQQHLSDLCDNSPTRCVIADLEIGRKQDLALAEAVALAHAFGLSVDQLADAEIPPTAIAIAAEIAAARERLTESLRLESRENLPYTADWEDTTNTREPCNCCTCRPWPVEGSIEQ